MSTIKLGVIIAKEQWTFFQEIYESLQPTYQTEVFNRRSVGWLFVSGIVNRTLLKWDLRRFINRNDLIFFEWAGQEFVKATVLPKKRPLIVRLHSYELYRFAPRAVWGNVDAVILCSQAMRRRFLKMFPDCEGKISVIYHGVSLDTFQPVSKEFGGQIGMLGNIAPIKRVYETVLAIYSLRQLGYDVSLRVAGLARDYTDERYPVAIEELVNKLELQSNITFDGWVEDPAQWLRSIDIFISNSYWESQHMAMLEAMASGCYCLAHCWGGVEELVPEEHIFVTNSDLVSKIASYCELTEFGRATIQKRMRQIAEKKFDIHRNQREIKEVIENVWRESL